MTKRYLLGLFIFFLLTTSVVMSCPVCYGTTETSASQGLSAAILTLLGITGGVLSAFVAFFIYIRKRAKITLNGDVDMPNLN